MGSMYEMLNSLAGIFKIFGRLFAQVMYSPVNAAVPECMVLVDAFDNRQRLLCGGAIIEINQRSVVHVTP